MKIFTTSALLLLFQGEAHGDSGLRNLQDGLLEATPISVDITCANVLCSEDAPICIEREDGPTCVSESCKTKVCEDIQVCIEETVFCFTSPCPPPIPKCIDNPCMFQRCGYPTPTCTVTNDGLAQCVGDDVETQTCKDKECSLGEVCVDLVVQCVRAPCPPLPTCIEDPCLVAKCAAGSSCEVDEEGKAVCVPTAPTITCANVRCGLPTPKCIETSSGPQCVADDCSAKECKEGETCVMEEVVCIQEPCPPIPTCVEKDPNPCLTAKCSAGFTCEADKEGNANCVPDPTVCEGFTCPNKGEVCEVTPVPCKALVCPNEPKCVSTVIPVDTLDACATIRCASGYICKDGQCLKDEPKWSFRDLKKNFDGTNLRRCSGRDNVAPTDGSKCSKRAKTCFFGNQECTTVPWHPDTSCFCDGQSGSRTWSCTKMECPSSIP